MQEGLMSVERSAGNECRAPAILVKVLKQSQKETTFLSGFQDEESDLLEESVILYRIGRMIALRQYQREREEEDSSIRNDLETVY